MTGGEGRHKNVGCGAFDGIVLDAGVDGFQDIVGTEAERTDIQGGIGDEVEQLGGVFHSDSGGFLDPLPEFAPEAFQHQLGRGLASGLFSDAANVQTDPLPPLVTKDVVSFLFEGLTPAGPPRRFLL